MPYSFRHTGKLWALGYRSVSQVCWCQVCRGWYGVGHGLIVIYLDILLR